MFTERNNEMLRRWGNIRRPNVRLAAECSVGLALLGLVVCVAAQARPMPGKSMVVIEKGLRNRPVASSLPTLPAPSSVPAVLGSGTIGASAVSASAVPVVSVVSAPPAPPAKPSASTEAPAAKYEVKLKITSGTKVLVFGDSMVDSGFQQRIRALAKERGATVVSDGWVSSSTRSWSKNDRLHKLIVSSQADVVIVALGANEVALPNPDGMAPMIRNIVMQLDRRPCVWVGPPIWKDETGIVGVEKKNAAPCGFFDSGNLGIERAKDGIHPTLKGGATWADAFWKANVAPE